MISALLTGESTRAQVLARVVSILDAELLNQVALADAAPVDSSPWDVLVLRSAANPLGSFVEGGGKPVINVQFDRSVIDWTKSELARCRRHTATYNVDCYASVVTAETAEGHAPGDVASTDESQRVAWLVEAILMYGEYTYLSFPQENDLPDDEEGQLVFSRRCTDATTFQPEQDGRPVHNVIGTRLQLDVELNEYAPQYVAETLELITTVSNREDDVNLVNVDIDATA